MIPDSIRGVAGVTPGEMRLFRMLRERLPAGAIVWYNVPVKGRHADFVVLDPRRGLLVLEVKDWRLEQIRTMSPSKVLLATERGESEVGHPLRQVREYALRIADTLSNDPILLAESGPYRGRLAFPFGYGIVWTKIAAREFRAALPQFSEAPMLFRDALVPGGASEFASALFGLLPFGFACDLTAAQVDSIRYRIFPEVRLPRPRKMRGDTQVRLFPAPEPTIAVMDLEQERLAKSIGDGHRLLRGVAGSGKTVTLVCRARLLAEANPRWRILVLCYNVSLASYLRQLVTRRLRAGVAAVEVANFHAFLAPLARDAGVGAEMGPEWANAVSEQLLERWNSGAAQAPRYDAILIDEAHDFASSWLRLVIACVNPETNSIFVAHDSAQNIYRKGFSFRKVGLQIQGRTRVLRTNYRNTREIAGLASGFLSRGVRFADGEPPRDDEGQLLEIIRPLSTTRSGPKPMLLACESFREECAEAAARIKHWIERGHYPPSDILLLYVKRGSAAGNDRYIRAMLDALSEAGVPHEWIARDRRAKRGFSIDSATVKVSTIHSAKGFDFAAVALVGVSMLPTAIENSAAERKLVYVGLTRAREMLLVTWCKESEFVKDLREALDDEV